MSSADERREAFHGWLNGALPDHTEARAVAFILNLYEGTETFDAQIAGATRFDAVDRSWAADTTFSSAQDLFSVQRAAVDDSWQRALRLYDELLSDYLRTGRRRDVLTAAQGIGVGFVDGDVIVVHPRGPAERIHAVFDYSDGPRHGVADFQGRPHAFICKFDDDLSDWSEFYHVKALTEEEFSVVMTDWEIWTRWLAAYNAGRVDLATHPALPSDAELHGQIKTRVQAALSVDTATAKTVWPKFHGRLPPDGDAQVTWSLVSG
jgi:hypothetical protein